MNDLEGKNILITGASSGIGREVAIQCSKMGANIILIGRNIEKLYEVIKLLTLGDHLPLKYDLLDLDNIKKGIIDKFKGKIISGFVHCAGIEKTVPVHLIKPQIYNEIFNINVFAGFELAKFLQKKGIYNENGTSFIFISSVRAFKGCKAHLVYSSSKGAIISAVKSLALELANKKIRVNCISPGIVLTDMVEKNFSIISNESVNNIIKQYPLGVGNSQDIANLILFLLSDISRWITGSNIIIDGGYSA